MGLLSEPNQMCRQQAAQRPAGPALPCPMQDASAILCCRAVPVLQHLAFVSPNAAELVAMAQAAHAAQQRQPNLTATSSQPPPPPPPSPPPPQQQQSPQQQESSSMQRSRQPQGSEAGSEARGLLRRLAPHLAVLLQVCAAGFYSQTQFLLYPSKQPTCNRSIHGVFTAATLHSGVGNLHGVQSRRTLRIVYYNNTP